MKDESGILQASDALNAVRESLSSRRVIVGFDGFVDEISHPVAVRKDRNEYSRVKTIDDFGARIVSAAGKSSNIELVPQVEKMGGNGPLMALAVCGMGCRVTCVGLMGYPEVVPVFKPLQALCRVVSVGNPGHTDALEFFDGKIMLGKLNTLEEMSWERLVEVCGLEGLRDMFTGSDLVACNNWTMLTEMDRILEQITALVPENSPVQFFFDLADPEKRPQEDLRRVLRQIRTLNAKARCVLGLNLREAQQVSHVLEIKDSVDESAPEVELAAVNICREIGLHGVVVHGLQYAGACLGGEHAGIAGPYCRLPRLSTGAGDHFNGGFCAGMLAGLSVRDALYLGVGTSGFYVRNARSPGLSDVTGLLMAWAHDELKD